MTTLFVTSDIGGIDMEPRRPGESRDIQPEIPDESAAEDALAPHSLPSTEEIDDAASADGTESPDDPYQDSDEALPDDVEERAIAQNPSRQEGWFGDT
ncbi:hypothetical protein J2Y48_003998 [Mycoplana sp. BE70]|uniref:hypothetical protein n=1 Tax=Mycoplana sp. BE70 TaxID=2817775 RepID=UPI002866BC35|nr:hypothetical protein [Mycoplana sp. BE70]MDR6758690.1 hypothetical protein [Mycoplana sp. BE70]